MKKTLNNINFRLLTLVILISGVSLAVQYALVGTQITQSTYIEHIIGMIIGGIAMIVIFNINLEKTFGIAKVAYFIILGFLMILVFNPPVLGPMLIGNYNGASAWIEIGSYTFQPVEFMKIILIFILAKTNVDHQQSMFTDIRLVRNYILYALPPIFLVFAQPDLGGFLLLVAPTVVLFLFGLKNKALAKTLAFVMGIGIVTVSILLFTEFGRSMINFIVQATPIEQYQLDRIDYWLQPFEHSKGYQLIQSLITIGSSDMFGPGFSAQLVSTSEIDTDFIFTAVVGYFGWGTGLILLFLYTCTLIETLIISINARSLVIKYITVGIWALLFLQVFENIGMTVGVLPITGIVLPLVSRGITAQLTFYIIFGILLRASIVEKNEYFMGNNSF